VPFIAGTNLDEGEQIFFLSEVGTVSYIIYSSGTIFTSRSINSEQEVHDLILARFSPLVVAPSLLDGAAKKLLDLYPDIPALGSPFGTGNETFGLSSVYKQTAAIRESTILRTHVRIMTDGFWLSPLPIVGDLAFQAQRHAWSQAASKAGVTNFGYLFTEPQLAAAIPSLGGKIRCSHFSSLVFQPLFTHILFGQSIMVLKSGFYTVIHPTLLQ